MSAPPQTMAGGRRVEVEVEEVLSPGQAQISMHSPTQATAGGEVEMQQSPMSPSNTNGGRSGNTKRRRGRRGGGEGGGRRSGHRSQARVSQQAPPARPPVQQQPQREPTDATHREGHDQRRGSTSVLCSQCCREGCGGTCCKQKGRPSGDHLPGHRFDPATEAPNFWRIWHHVVSALCGVPIDMLVSAPFEQDGPEREGDRWVWRRPRTSRQQQQEDEQQQEQRRRQQQELQYQERWWAKPWACVKQTPTTVLASLCAIGCGTLATVGLCGPLVCWYVTRKEIDRRQHTYVFVHDSTIIAAAGDAEEDRYRVLWEIPLADIDEMRVRTKTMYSTCFACCRCEHSMSDESQNSSLCGGPYPVLQITLRSSLTTRHGNAGKSVPWELEGLKNPNELLNFLNTDYPFSPERCGHGEHRGGQEALSDREGSVDLVRRWPTLATATAPGGGFDASANNDSDLDVVQAQTPPNLGQAISQAAPKQRILPRAAVRHNSSADARASRYDSGLTRAAQGRYSWIFVPFLLDALFPENSRYYTRRRRNISRPRGWNDLAHRYRGAFQDHKVEARLDDGGRLRSISVPGTSTFRIDDPEYIEERLQDNLLDLLPDARLILEVYAQSILGRAGQGRPHASIIKDTDFMQNPNQLATTDDGPFALL